jgi:AraC-like DNA-binding protein
LAVEPGEVTLYPVIQPSLMNDVVDISEDFAAGVWRSLELFIGTISQSDIARASARFAFAAPPYLDTYAKTFSCPLYFDAERTEVRIPADWLRRPVTTANPAVAKLCQATCKQVMCPIRDPSDYSEEVTRLVLSQVGRQIPLLEQAAKMLHLSPDQLRRRLYESGTCFRRVIVEARMTLARHYLETSLLPIEDIAYLLDYSEAASFIRAFRRETGTSPARYRLAARRTATASAQTRTSDLRALV